jgi:hypothetical protein
LVDGVISLSESVLGGQRKWDGSNGKAIQADSE